MSYCSKCGKQILDESLGCPICSLNENTTNFDNQAKTEVEVVEEFTVEDDRGTSQKFETKSEEKNWEDYRSTEPQPVQEQTLHVALKIVIIILVLLAGGIGQVAGIIAGIILLKSPLEDYRKFGKTLIVVSCVMLAVWLLCCILGGLFGLVGNMAYYY
ncbi:MAG: hypothetical protein ACK5I7_04160 [Anaerotignum sp.]